MCVADPPLGRSSNGGILDFDGERSSCIPRGTEAWCSPAPSLTCTGGSLSALMTTASSTSKKCHPPLTCQYVPFFLCSSRPSRGLPLQGVAPAPPPPPLCVPGRRHCALTQSEVRYPVHPSPGERHWRTPEAP